MEERPRGLSSTDRKRGTAVLNIPRGETKVVLQQRLKLEGSVTKVTGSFGFLGRHYSFLHSLKYLGRRLEEDGYVPIKSKK